MSETNEVKASDGVAKADHACVYMEGGGTLALVQFPILAFDTEGAENDRRVQERKANARYLAAAWNFCKATGISLDAMESDWFRESVKSAIDVAGQFHVSFGDRSVLAGVQLPACADGGGAAGGGEGGG